MHLRAFEVVSFSWASSLELACSDFWKDKLTSFTLGLYLPPSVSGQFLGVEGSSGRLDPYMFLTLPFSRGSQLGPAGSRGSTSAFISALEFVSSFHRCVLYPRRAQQCHIPGGTWWWGKALWGCVFPRDSALPLGHRIPQLMQEERKQVFLCNCSSFLRKYRA